MITGRNDTVSPGGYCDLYLLHRLTLLGGSKIRILFFLLGRGWGGGGGIIPYIFLVCSLRAIF